MKLDRKLVLLPLSMVLGAAGSRLLSGNNVLLKSFENQIARDKNTPYALPFTRDYQVNISTVPALLDIKILTTQPLVFLLVLMLLVYISSVFLNGSSLLIRYCHQDMDRLL